MSAVEANYDLLPVAQPVVVSKEELVQQVTDTMTAATMNFLTAVAEHPAIEPPQGERETTVTIHPVEGPISSSGWTPAKIFEYESSDPWQHKNPELTAATASYVGTIMEQAALLGETRDPALTYLTMNRSKGGRRSTLLTDLILRADPVLAEWARSLPDAERLRPVANPWSDVPTIVRNPDGSFRKIESSPALLALTGGCNDGLGVREREGLEGFIVVQIAAERNLPGNKLVITSVGTGTGEPAMDSSISAMAARYAGVEHSIDVYGFDINKNSLAIANYLAAHKSHRLQFFGNSGMDILTDDGIDAAIGGTQPDIIEAMGFTEYVPSDGAPTDIERRQRKLMARMGRLSAQAFYAAIYRNMKSGAVFVTGNMRDDSPQASFVVDGLGWQGIIQRSTKDYMRILEEAGIPGEAVTLYLPSKKIGKIGSSAVCNLVAITKL